MKDWSSCEDMADVCIQARGSHPGFSSRVASLCIRKGKKDGVILVHVIQFRRLMMKRF